MTRHASCYSLAAMKAVSRSWGCSIFLLSLLGGCAQVVRPDDMSAEAHRREAARERAKAAAEARQFDPDAEARVVGAAGDERSAPQPDAGTVQPLAGANPTTWHLLEAERRRQHAREHERAAAVLEGTEAARCGDLTDRERSACPFLGPVRAVEEIDRGVRIVLAPGAPLSSIVEHMRCQLAFARTRGYEVPACPLSVAGSEVALAADGGGIDLTSNTSKGARELRRRASALVSAGH